MQARLLSTFLSSTRTLIHCGLILFVLLSTLLFSQSASAATGISNRINYQARLMDVSGFPVADGSYSIQFSLYDAATAGTRVWTAAGTVAVPTAISVSVQNGLFTVLLGDTGQNTLDTVDWNQDNLFLGITISADSEMTPRKRLASAPQAFNARQLNGMYASSTVFGANNLFSLHQTSNTAATGTRTTLEVRSAGTSNVNDFLIRGVNDLGTAVFTVNRQGNVTTTGNLVVSGSATTTNLFVSGTASTSALFVNGRTVCLSDGTNCTSSTSTESDTLASVTARGSSATTTVQLFGGLISASTTVTSTFTVLGNSLLQGTTFTLATGTSVTTTNLFTTYGQMVNASTTVFDAYGTASLRGNANIGDASSDILTITSVVGSNIMPQLSDTYSLGGVGQAWKGFFSAVTSTVVTTTNLFATNATTTWLGASTVSTTNLFVNGQTVCLTIGTNCPSSSEINWTFSPLTGSIRVSTSSNDVLIGGASTSTGGVVAYYDTNGTTGGASNVFFGYNTNTNVVIGSTTTTGQGLHSLFTLNGNDLYVGGNIGAVSSVYTNGAFIAGTGTTMFGDGFISKTNGKLTLTASENIVADSRLDALYLNRWFLSPLLNDTVYGGGRATTPVGTGPSAVAFDGSHIWVANFSSDNVSKIDVTTNAVVATTTVGTSPYGIAFDGSYMWVANFASDNVSKIDVTTNAVVATTTGGAGPAAVAFDGNYIWVANFDSDNVSKINVTTNAVVATTPVGSAPQGIAFDGGYMWVTNSGSDNVSIIDITTDAVVATTTVGGDPIGVAFDGSYMWAVNGTSGNVSKIDISTYEVVATTTVGSTPQGIAFDGNNIWVSNYDDNEVSKIDVTTNVVVATMKVGTSPVGIAFDGSHIWVANSGSDDVSKLPIGGSSGANMFCLADGTDCSTPTTDRWFLSPLLNDTIRGGAHATTTVGSTPKGVVFDGSHIWVANYAFNSVSVIDILTNAVTQTVPVGTNPEGIAFDGSSIWVANSSDDTVSKIDMHTYTVVATVPVGTTPTDVAFDGSFIWVTNSNGGGVKKINITTNSVVATVLAGTNPIAAAFDGSYIWVLNFGSGNVSKIDITANLEVATVPVGTFSSGGLAFDGTYIWVANDLDNNVQKIDVMTNSVVATTTVSSPQGIAFDGSHMWVANSSDDTVSKIDVKTNAIVKTVPVGSSPDGIAFDGSHMWVANSGSNTVSKFPIGGGSGADMNLHVNLLPDTNNLFNIGSATNSFRNIYASGTANIGTDVLVNGVSVCLVNGTNCPTSSGSEINWTFSPLTGSIRVSTSSNDVLIGGVSTSTGGVAAYFDTNGTTGGASNVFFGYNTNTNVIIGSTTTTGEGLHSLFTLNGNDLYVGGNIGSVSSVYTNGAFIAGTGTTMFGDGFITKSDGKLTLTASENIVAASRLDALYLNRWFISPLLNNTVYGGGRATETVGSSPGGIAFDGSHIWVANLNSDNVSKIDITTNAVVATTTVGTSPRDIAFDGSYMWVANSGSDDVSKIDITTNAVVATTPVGTSPFGAAFDGSYIWVANFSSNNVSKIDITTNAVVATTPVGTSPFGAAFDGSHIWVANFGSDNVSKIDITTNAVVATTTVGINPLSVAFDGGHMWVVNSGSDNVSKIDIKTNLVVATTTVGTSPGGVAFDGSHVWVTSFIDSITSKIDITTNAVVATTTVGQGASGITFDGGHMWVSNSSDNNVSKFPIGGGSGANMNLHVNLVPDTNNLFDIGSGANSFRNIYASGTARIATDVLVGGVSVCLSNGTNCPTSSGSEINWTFSPLTGSIRVSTSSNDVLIGGVSTSTGGVAAYFDTNGTMGGASNVFFGYNTNTNVVIGSTTTTGQGLHSLFTLNGNDLYVGGNIGSVSSVYTNGAFIAGTGTTMFGDGFISKTNGDLAITASGDILVGSTTTFLGNVGFGTSTDPITQLHVPGRVPTAAAGSVILDGAGSYEVFIQGKFAYVANSGVDTLQVVDISDPAAPTSVGSVLVGTDPVAVHVQGQYAYVLDQNGDTMEVVDVSNPSAPIVKATTAVDEGPISITVQGNYAFVLSDGTTDTFQVYNISDPLNPALVTSTQIGTAPSSIAVQDRYAYITSYGNNTLEVFDIGFPGSPSSVGSVLTGVSPIWVHVQGRYAYVTTQVGETLEIIDVSSSTAPMNIGSVSLGAIPYGVYVQGRNAYVANLGDDAMLVIDVSSSTAPTIVGSVPTDSGPTSIYVQGRFAAVANNSGGTLQIFDVGGAYIQQLETGGLETATLSVLNSLQAGDASFRGGLTVGTGGILSSGPLSVYVSSTALAILDYTGTVISTGRKANGNGAAVTIVGGAGAGFPGADGGSVSLTGADADLSGSDAFGGGINLTAGASTGSLAFGGEVIIGGGGGMGGASGGDINLNGGVPDFVSGGDGGEINLNAGGSYGSGLGGGLYLTSGDAFGSGDAGDSTLDAGLAFGVGSGGSVNLTAGHSFGGGAGGNIVMTTGINTMNGDTGSILIQSTAGGDPVDLRFVEDGDIGSEFVGFRAPFDVTSSTIWLLPASDGTSGQVLSTDGSGNLSFITAGGGGSANDLNWTFNGAGNFVHNATQTTDVVLGSSSTILGAPIFFDLSGGTLGTSTAYFGYNTNTNFVIGGTSTTGAGMNELFTMEGNDMLVTGGIGTNLMFASGRVDLPYLNRWFTNPLLTQTVYKGGRATVAVGTGPHGMAFDGSHMWVANHDDTPGTVSKIDPLTNTVVATTTFVGPSQAWAIAFDGTYIWVTDEFGSGDVSKINPITNTVVATVITANNPQGLVYDGTYLWVVNSSGSVTKVSTTSNTAIVTIGIGTPLATVPHAAAFDGTYVWVLNGGSSPSISKIDPATDSVIATTTGLGVEPGGIAFDGTSLWVSNAFSDTLSKVNITSNLVVATVTVGDTPIDVAFDGTYIWVANTTSDNVSIVDPKTNVVVATLPAGIGARGLAFDGSHMWVANEVDGTVTKLPIGVGNSPFNSLESVSSTIVTTTHLAVNSATGTANYQAVIGYAGSATFGGLCLNDTNTGPNCPTTGIGSASILADGAITASAFDLAEKYPLSGSATSSDLLILDTSANTTVKVSEAVPYDSRLIGIASTDPGFVLGWTGGVAVALSGRVPLKVSMNNGPILAGDALTSSNIAGYAMKATKPGKIVGYALHDQASDGTVETFVNVGYWAGNVLGTDGTISTINDSLTVQSIGPATALDTAQDSHNFTFRGEAWDSVSSTVISSSFTLLNDIINATTSRFTIRSTSGTDLFAVDQDGDGTIAGSLSVGGKLFPSSKGGGLQDDWYVFVDDTSSTAAYISTNADGWQSMDTYDFAERYYSPDELEPGDLVVVSNSGRTHVQRSLNENQMLLGIVSTRPAFIAGRPATSTYPIALSGRVPTKVSGMNGAIKAGDPLAPTTIPGVAAKAVETGPIVGLALEDFDGADVGLIEVFVNPGYWVNKAELDAALEEEHASAPAATNDVKQGLADIALGATKVTVTFPTIGAYPHIQATAYGQVVGEWWINAITDTGFEIVLSSPQNTDIRFSWSAEPTQSGEQVYHSDNSHGPVDPMTGQGNHVVEEEDVVVTSTEPIVEEVAPVDVPPEIPAV